MRARTPVFETDSAAGEPIAWLACAQHVEVLASGQGETRSGLRVRTDSGVEGFVFQRSGAEGFVVVDPAKTPQWSPPARRECALLETRAGVYAENALASGPRGEPVPAAAASVWLACGDVVQVLSRTSFEGATVVRVRTGAGVEGAIFQGSSFGEFAAEFPCTD
jgi:hypothetical protein